MSHNFFPSPFVEMLGLQNVFKSCFASKQKRRRRIRKYILKINGLVHSMHINNTSDEITWESWMRKGNEKKRKLFYQCCLECDQIKRKLRKTVKFVQVTESGHCVHIQYTLSACQAIEFREKQRVWTLHDVYFRLSASVSLIFNFNTSHFLHFWIAH